MDRVAALLLAGGRGTGFGALSDQRTKAAFPVASNYRIIDFALSNLSHSGIRQVGIVIQYLPAPLLEHIGSGRPWEFDMADRSLRFMTPFVGVNETRWFRGTADAIAQNLNLLNLQNVEHVLILSADHVYSMDYRKIVHHHQTSGADVTMAYVEIPAERQHPRFGNLTITPEGRVKAFVEKPPQPISSCVSMGIFCFRLETLMDLLTISKPGDVNEDFNLATHVLQPHVSRINTQGWRFDGQWHYMADLREYFDFHMQLARGEIQIFDSQLSIMTNFSDRNLGWRPPLYCSPECTIRDAIIGPGCRIEGEVVSSVLSPGVTVAPGAVVRNSILLHDVHVGEGCRIDNSVVDKDVFLALECHVGEPGDDSDDRNMPITVVPKDYRLRRRQRLISGETQESIVVR